jgi:hypothetical protein
MYSNEVDQMKPVTDSDTGLLRRDPRRKRPARQRGHQHNRLDGTSRRDLKGRRRNRLGSARRLLGRGAPRRQRLDRHHLERQRQTIYLTDITGNTVKVTLSSAAKIAKSESVSRASVRAGDVVVVQGLKSSNGTITAISASDSGVSATHSGAAPTGSGGNTTNTDTAG